MKQERKLNFEALRIVSMILIVVFHYSDWGKVMYIEGNTVNRLIGDFINIGGRLGVNLFVLISGYFLVNSKFKIKKLIKLIFQVWCYSVGITLVCYILKIGDISKTTLIKSLLPITYNMYWFVTSYASMYLLSPFINKVINNMEKTQHKTLIIILGLLLSVIPTIIFGSNICNSNLIWFIYLYIIAAYIKKYNIEFVKKRRTYLLSSILIWIFMFAVSVLCFAVRTKIPYIGSKEVYLNEMHTLPMLLLSISIFMYFKNINIGKNKVVEFCAKGVFAVYLIQMNASLRTYLFSDILKIQEFHNASPLILIAYILITSMILFVGRYINRNNKKKTYRRTYI